MTPKLAPATYIDTDDALRDLVQELQDEPLLAVDTESNNLYSYRTKVCLIQMSTRTQDYIIDPLAIRDMQPLGKLFADPTIEKIFHAAEYDLICMNRDFGFEVCNLFDTMFAARLVHIENFGLGDILSQYFDVDVDKRHQRDDWGKRPLPQDSLLYAQMDTHYLPELRDKLLTQLEALDRLEEAHEIFLDVLNIDVKSQDFDPDGFWKLGLPRSLNRREMAYLREVYLEREEIAEKRDVPPFKVVGNKALVALARKPPNNLHQMRQLREFAPSQVRRYGERFLDALSRGRKAPLPKRPHNDLPDPVVAERYTTLHSWRKERAAKRNLDSSLILSKQTLWEIAREMPRNLEELGEIQGMGAWRVRTYGEEILKLLRTMR